MSSGLRVLAAIDQSLLLQAQQIGRAAPAPIANRFRVLRALRAKVVGTVALAAAAVLGCGGGGSYSGGMSGTVAAPGPSYSFAADGGVRVPGGVQPVELVVGATTYMFLSGSATANGKVLSSTDGLTFTPVSATLDGAPLVGTSFSFVALAGGGFRMYYLPGPGSAAPGSLSSATSSNGLTWTSEPGTRIVLNDIGVPKVTALPTGGYRVYYTTSGGPTGIASATSSDGLTFSADAGLRLSPTADYMWGDPNVVVSGNAYLMSATQMPASQGQPTQGYSTIWLASSTDGLTWTLGANPIITNATGSPVDSSFVSRGNGAFRVYFGVFLGSSAVPVQGTQSEVLSGVLTPTM
jgi:hypothetical protein